MSIETTYTDARARLARLMDQVTEDRETVIIRRRNARSVAMIAADELESLTETAHVRKVTAVPHAGQELSSCVRETQNMLLSDISGTLQSHPARQLVSGASR